MAVTLVRVPNVPIVTTGTYNLSTGPFTFTEEHLAAAVDAQSDPGVLAPRIKLGHTDPREGFDGGADLDGQPALGWVEGMTLSADRQTITATLVVPDWLAESMEYAYPARSVEAWPGFESGSGRTHELVISALSLLGERLPAVLTLDDLRELLSEAGSAPTTPAPVAASMRPRIRQDAGLSIDLVRSRFVDAIDSGDLQAPDGVSSWDIWPRCIRVEDDGSLVLIATDDASGRLYRVPFTVSGGEVNFGDMQEVVEQYVAASSVTQAPRPVAVWASRAEARHPTQEAGRDMTDEQRRALALSLGLPEDSNEDAIHSAAATRAETPPDPQPDPAPQPDPQPDQQPDPDSEPAPAPEPQAVAARLPNGVVAIDEAELARLRAGAATAERLEADRRRGERDQTIDAAVRQGRIPRSRIEHYARLWDGDPEGTRTLLTAAAADGGLAPNTIPVAEIGRTDTEGQSALETQLQTLRSAGGVPSPANARSN